LPALNEGLNRGADALIGLPGDAWHGARYLANKVLGSNDPINDILPTSESLRNRREAFTGPGYEPQTTAGGSGVAISGARFITAMSPSTDRDTGLAYTGTGTTGTYGVGGAAATVAVGTVSASPDNIFPGGWSVPGTLACASASHVAAPFQRAFADETTPGGVANPGAMGQVTHQGNYADLTAYGAGGPIGFIWSQRAAPGTFNGTIVGTALTVNSDTPPYVGERIVTTTGVAAGTNIVSGTTPNFVVSVSQNIGPISMNAVATFCNNPTIWGSSIGNPNVDMAGIYNSTQMNSYNAETVPGNGCE
jgi:hypothetical protein